MGRGATKTSTKPTVRGRLTSQQRGRSRSAGPLFQGLAWPFNLSANSELSPLSPGESDQVSTLPRSMPLSSSDSGGLAPRQRLDQSRAPC